MKKYRQSIFYRVVLLTAIILYGFHSHTNPQKPVIIATPGFAVVELFTSEGCSSCPAADKLAGIIASENINNVYILSFHVDYWNRLGWKDVFSNSAYSERQKQYAGMFKLKSIYTPQMVINGKTEFVGSDENKLRRSIQQELKNNSLPVIELRTGITDAKTVSVSCGVSSTNKILLNIALVQKHAETSVKKGENQGKLLQHINIVRDFKTLTMDHNINGKVTLSIPDGLSPKDFRVIAFAQNIDDLRITAAMEKEL